MEFSKEIAELKAEVAIPVQPVLSTTSFDSGTEGVTHRSERLAAKRNELLRMVSFSTRVAIMEAWLEVEAAATEVASSFWSTSHSDVFKNYPRLGDYLLQCKVIDQKELETFKKLQQLRNKAAHAQELNLSEEDVRSYVEIATALAAHIRAYQLKP